MFGPDVLHPLRLFLELVRRLDRVCVIGGSVASSLHGIPRQTIDLDVVIELEETDVLPLLRAAEPDFYVSEVAVREAIRHRRAFNLIHGESGFKVDVYVSGTSDFDRAQLDRAVELELPGLPHLPVRVASPEDVVLRKLDWYRSGQQVSDRQWYDLVGVLKVQRGRIDAVYLDLWADRLGLRELLDRARTEAGGVSGPPAPPDPD